MYVRQQMSNVNMEATTILPILKKKLAFLSGNARTHTRAVTTLGLHVLPRGVRGLRVLSLVSNQIFAGLSNLRGQRSAQWSDPDHPSQLRPDQHGGAQCNTGLPAQHPQVHTHTHTPNTVTLACEPSSIRQQEASRRSGRHDLTLCVQEQ